MTSPAKSPGPNAERLKKLLDRDDEVAGALRTRFHRTLLWNLYTGRRRPSVQTATEMETIAGAKRLPASGWVTEEDARGAA